MGHERALGAVAVGVLAVRALAASALADGLLATGALAVTDGSGGNDPARPGHRFGSGLGPARPRLTAPGRRQRTPHRVGDELLCQAVGDVVVVLLRWRLHQPRAGPNQGAADLVVQRQLAEAHRVDDDAGTVGAVVHLELELKVQGHVAKRLALEADEGPFAVA